MKKLILYATLAAEVYALYRVLSIFCVILSIIVREYVLYVFFEN